MYCQLFVVEELPQVNTKERILPRKTDQTYRITIIVFSTLTSKFYLRFVLTRFLRGRCLLFFRGFVLTGFMLDDTHSG